MANTDLPNAKIIILFILSKVDSIPSAKLTDCALESLYVDYFLFSQAKKELLDARLMTESVRKNESRKDASGRPILSCDITPEGKAILNRLLPSVPTGIRAYLSSASKSWRHEASEEKSVQAEYAPNGEGTWDVDLRLVENDATTFSLHWNAPSEAAAERTCKRWKSEPAEMYLEIIRLISEEK
ncbi:MAG: DUF4364 family protein [Clostridiales bacterium]|jgi:hypothetical protein|nr:DUF4364 family protein [Clostridiales bacterium]